MTTPSSTMHVIRCGSGRRPLSGSNACGPAAHHDDATIRRYEWRASLQGHILWIDPEWEQWIGWAVGSWRGTAWLQSIAPSDRAQVAAQHLRSFQCQAAMTFTCHVIRGDTQPLVQMTVIPLVLAGRLAGARGWIDVVTASAQKEISAAARKIVR
jgi:hypothetical protein